MAGGSQRNSLTGLRQSQPLQLQSSATARGLNIQVQSSQNQLYQSQKAEIKKTGLGSYRDHRRFMSIKTDNLIM